MKITQIFGPVLLPMMHYVGWLQTQEAEKFFDNEGCNYVLNHDLNSLVRNAHTFLSQDMREEWFVRPEKPNYEFTGPESVSNVKYVQYMTWFNEERSKHDDWKPLFLEEWEIIKHNLEDGPAIRIWTDKAICWMEDTPTLNDFATHCYKKGNELKLNPEFQWID